MEFDQALGDGRVVAEVAARKNDPVRYLPVEVLHDFETDRFLAFDAERIYRIYKINPFTVTDLLNQFHGIVEIALDLDGFGPVGEGLTEFAKRDFPFWDEDDGIHAGSRCVGGHRSGGVSRARTGH